MKGDLDILDRILAAATGKKGKPSQELNLDVVDAATTAGLLPLDHDHEGRDHHGGRIANPAQTLGTSMDALEEAGALAAELRRNCDARRRNC